MAHLLVPQRLLVEVDIAAEKFTKKTCDALKTSLKMVSEEVRIGGALPLDRPRHRRRRLQRGKDGFGVVVIPRSASAIREGFSCSPMEPFATENVNTALHPRAARRSKRNKSNQMKEKRVD
jgi:hypothetical protein